MIFNSVFAYIFLLASAAIAVPPSEHSQPQLLRIRQSTSNTTDSGSGAVLESFPPGTFEQVNATFAVPTLYGPIDSNGYAFVGIDGMTCTRAMLRAGIEFQVTQQGPQYQVWVQWYPDALQNIDIGLAAGDRLHISLVAMTPLNGLVTIRNNRTGEQQLLFVGSETSLCMSDAGWFVGKTDNPLTNFGEVVFDDAKGVGGGKEYMPEEAHLYDLEEGNKVLATASVCGATVTVKYE